MLFYLTLYAKSDDTIFRDHSLEEHWWRTTEFLTFVSRTGVILNLKFQFAQRNVDFGIGGGASPEIPSRY